MSKHTAGSASQYSFSRVPRAEIPRCRLIRRSTHKTTLNAGLLYPIFYDEVMPGDTFKLRVGALCRMTTQIVPVMDNLYMDFQFFYIPYRLLWKHWNNMHGEQENPNDSIDYTAPYVMAPSGGVTVGSLADYFGLPLGVEWAANDVNAFPFRAYNLTWNCWFRDENLQNSVTFTNEDGNDTTNYVLLPRGKRKDYFTSALPWPQKGETVPLPIGFSAPVEVFGNGKAIGLDNGNEVFPMQYYRSENGQRLQYGAPSRIDDPIGTVGPSSVNQTAGQLVGVSTNADDSHLVGLADLSNATASTINDLREAFQIQRLFERAARGGTRANEQIFANYGVTVPDLRVMRPELLGTFSLRCAIDQVEQSSATMEGTTAQGNLAANGTFAGVKNAFTKSFTEWGCVLGLVSIRSDLGYQQGINRIFSKAKRFDWYYPALAHLGEQEILNKEIFAQGKDVKDYHGNVIDDMAFGYQERWSEYKYGLNKITGELRSTAPQSLDVWHLAQKFDNLPTLSSQFIQENPPLNRIIAVTDSPQFIFDSIFDCECIRPLPLYCVPGLIDHF